MATLLLRPEESSGTASPTRIQVARKLFTTNVTGRGQVTIHLKTGFVARFGVPPYYAAFDAEHRPLASKAIADQVPIEHVRNKKDQAKNIE